MKIIFLEKTNIERRDRNPNTSWPKLLTLLKIFQFVDIKCAVSCDDLPNQTFPKDEYFPNLRFV